MIDFLYTYCTDCVINLANLLGISYYEMNTVIFLILWPTITALLVSILIIQRIRIKVMRR